MKKMSVKQRGKILDLSLKAEEVCRQMEKLQSDLNELQKEVDEIELEHVCEDCDDAVHYALDMADKLREIRREM